MKSHCRLIAALFFGASLLPVATPGQTKQPDPATTQGQGKGPELTEIQYLESWFDARNRGDIRGAFEVGKAYLARHPRGALAEEFRDWVRRTVEMLDARSRPAAAAQNERTVAQADKGAGWEDLQLEPLLADLQENAFEEIRLSSGRTLLMLAAANGNAERVNTLLRKGVHVNWTDSTRNWSALIYAIRKGHAGIVRALIDAGADVTIKDKDGKDAADHARLTGNPEVIRVVQGGARR